MSVNKKECEKAGLDYKVVKTIADGLSKYGKMAEKLGIQLFGGSGSGSLRYSDQSNDVNGRSLVIGYFDGYVDGGDGGCIEDEEGLMRGE